MTKRFAIDYDLEDLEDENVKLRAKIEEQQEQLKLENERLNQAIIDLHDDMRRCKQKIKMQDNIIDTQQDIINTLCELVSLINDKE